MNDEKLETILHELSVPEQDESAKAKALYRATLALGADDLLPETKAIRFPWLTSALSVLAVILGTYILFQSLTSENQATLEIAEVLQEMETLFPGRISALIWRDGELAVELAEASGDVGQPVEIVLSRDGDQIRVVSFSGREVCMDINGQEVCLEVLLSGKDDTAILVGNHYIWTQRNPASLEGYQVRVQAMKGTST